ncbi:SufD family Fe-S cluster assembly protein [Rhodobacter capsulatus]|uniref:SufB/SufD family protein n=1 Tax=Rhodobacter capsulatus TaxID=1061 RepID=UPI0006DCB7C0|nr:SufD family Fe-S cluster assembly protein [Rhodobacter capsulatus]KQB17092.1 Fe-S cluster assembly protein SufD [Rhodobacter capsulatus]KQB17490.1 Fe-S cluster assembly protein SufD [Rhodobacter capsulatus]PZX27540.1 Fe-S cluster assembly protein SufD [Rhodobacter capsulatus]QNR64609.1 SufD family Fe-S cluster assembly protein [Rhodobacter capsulatus]
MAAKEEMVAARLAGLTAGPGLSGPRAAARARLAAMGLPGRRDEYWRWTDPAALNAVTPAPATAAAEDEAPLFDALDRLKIVFVDGVFDAAASDDLALSGVEIARIADKIPGWAEALYGTLEAAGQDPVKRPFAALNTAQATDGVLIRVTAAAAKPINLIYVHKSELSDPILHHLVQLEPGAELTLLETGPAGARFNKVMEVDLAAGARFHHIRAQGPDSERRAVTHVFARVAEKALFKSFTVTVNGALTRNEAVIDIIGNDAVAHVAGAALGDGATGAFLHDDTVFVTHAGLRCESRQVFKKVLKHGAIGTFQGKILVKPGAQKTDGYQISQSLLLDDDSQFLAKPELEIYADDVKCSHGSTTGAIDETALFYLRSRGVPEEEAKGLLVLSFLADAIDEIEDAGLKEEIVARLETWLSRHRD